MPSESYVRAPRWRTTLAGLLDAGLLGGVLWVARGRETARPVRLAASLLAPTGEFVREQLASPGQRLLGVRTVDRRTGRRLDLWRTGTLVGFAALAQLLERRLRPGADPAGEARRSALAAEIGAIGERYRDDPARRDAEFRRAALDSGLPPVLPGLARIAGAGIALGAARRRLRRRLAPTVEVLARGHSSHSP